MSGRKIDDHSFWAGKGSEGSVLPLGSKMKRESGATGAGAEMDYEDTAEKIRSQQEKGAAKARSHEMKAGYRN